MMRKGTFFQKNLSFFRFFARLFHTIWLIFWDFISTDRCRLSSAFPSGEGGTEGDGWGEHSISGFIQTEYFNYKLWLSKNYKQENFVILLRIICSRMLSSIHTFCFAKLESLLRKHFRTTWSPETRHRRVYHAWGRLMRAFTLLL